MSKIGFQNPLPEIQRMCLQKMYPRTLFIIFLSSELHAGPYETKHNIFLFQKRSQKFAFRSTIFFIQKGHFGPLWPSQKLIFTNFRHFFEKTIEKYNEAEFENIFKLFIILKNKKVMVTWRWPPNFVSPIFLLYKNYLKSLTGCGMTIFGTWSLAQYIPESKFT